MSIEFKDSGLTPSFYARFESGALTTDSSGEGHTLTAISDPAEDASGKFGGAVAFDGNDAYSAVDHADFKPTGNFTIGCWVKKASISYNVIFSSVETRNTPNTNYAGILFTVAVTTGYLGLFLGYDADPALIFSGGINVCDGNWHFAVVTYDGAHVNFYVDGNLDTSTDNTTNPSYYATNFVRIGCWASTRLGDGATPFTGSLDDLFLINGTALSAAQILNIYQNYIISATVGAFTLAGIDISFNRTITMITETGSYILTGMDVLFNRTISMIASVGEYILTGVGVRFEYYADGWKRRTKPDTVYTTRTKPTTTWTKRTKPE